MNKSLRLKVISSLILQLGITLVLSSCQQLDRTESEFQFKLTKMPSEKSN